jgi:hypothetical protein
MNKLDSRPPVLMIPPGARPDREADRLIVLLTDPHADPANVARRLCELSRSLGCSIQLLGLCKDPSAEPEMRRYQITLSAMIEQSGRNADSRIEFGSDWLALIRAHVQTGDALVCFTGQRSGLNGRPLYQLLETKLNVAVYVLSDLTPGEGSPVKWIPALSSWIGSAAIILGFFWMQASLITPPQDWAHTAMLVVSIPAEMWLVWFWNSLFGSL